MIDEAGNSLLTSNHVNRPICLLAIDAEVLVNPNIRNHTGSQRWASVLTPSLCSSDAEPYHLAYYEAIELNYQDISATNHSLSFNGTLAAQIQKALEILNGVNICMWRT